MFLLVPAYPGSPGQKAVKRLCVCVCVCVCAWSEADGRRAKRMLAATVYPLCSIAVLVWFPTGCNRADGLVPSLVLYKINVAENGRK